MSTLKTTINLNYTQRPSPYRAVNTVPIGYKNQTFKAVYKIIAIYSEIRIKPPNAACEQNVEILGALAKL